MWIDIAGMFFWEKGAIWWFPCSPLDKSHRQDDITIDSGIASLRRSWIIDDCYGLSHLFALRIHWSILIHCSFWGYIPALHDFFVQVVSPWSPSILASNQNASIGISVGRSSVGYRSIGITWFWDEPLMISCIKRPVYVSLHFFKELPLHLLMFLQFWNSDTCSYFHARNGTIVAANQGFNLRCKCHWAPKDSSSADIHDPESYGWHSCHPDCCPF